MSLDLYLAYLAVVMVFFLSPPGPSHLLMISNSMIHGMKRSLATAAGDLTANTCQMTAAAFGLAVVVAQSAEALAVVKWAGVAYLAWMGIAKFRAPVGRIDPAKAARARRLSALFRQGFLTSAANPKAVVFFAALFPQFIDPAVPIWPQLLILGGTYLVVDGTLLALWGRLAETSVARVRALSDRVLNRVSGAMLIAAAAALAGKDIADVAVGEPAR